MFRSCFLISMGALCSSFCFPFFANAQLLVDFNSTSQDGGPHNQSGYEPYNAGHESASDFVAPRNYPAFGTTVSLTVDFPDSSANTVQQMIDRGSGNDANWNGQKLDLLTDWIGVDTRPVAGLPRITFTLDSLPAGTYQWLSYHHDTENVWGSFDLEVSTNGGSSYTPIAGPEAGGSFTGTDSSPGGNPTSPQAYSGAGNQDPATLPSTVTFSFDAVGGSNVVVSFTPLAGAAVHTQLITINGLEITSTSPPTAPTDIALSGSTIAATATIGTSVGTLSTTDPTPGDTFTYALVGGSGSTNNADFAIVGDQLQTDRDLSGQPGGTMLSVRIRTTDMDSDSFEKVFLIEVVNDSDGDGLDDTWELTYFNTLGDATGTGDNEPDGLNNLGEQAAGTNPTIADSDGDSLTDGAEVNTHNTDPLVADSDGDGIDDGDELSASNGYITDPNLFDTDGDGFNDGLEIAEGNDPTNAADFPNTLLPLRLNEILARNDTDISDGDGDRHDWIEIYNPNTVAVNLDGFYLTDDEFLLTQWNFPNVTIAANGYLVVFASGKDIVDGGGNPHTNFQLGSNGEYLAIVRPNGTTIDDSFAPGYPEQVTDVSYGLQSGTNNLVFFQDSTPGAVNNTTAFPGVVKDTNFSIDRGFHDTAFQLAITSATAGATIRYTTDGSWPSTTSGTVYSGPITVPTTTSVRAIAYQSGWLSTNVDTHTYIFVNDVAQQPSNPAGWPSDWGSHDGFNPIPSDYEMDPRVVNDTNGFGVHTIQEALLDIPTVSIAMNPDDFMSDASGIYANPQNRTERTCSVEYILPDGSSGFQENCKIETHGNASRRPARMHKHSLRLTFSSEVGVPKLRYPLFPQTDVEEFNKLVLRACFTDSWALCSWSTSRYRPNDSMYMRDVWMKDSMAAMGNKSGNGDFVHLYVNGLYWGLHDLTERLEDDWYADHHGGEVEDWEVNADMSSPGTLWSQMMGVLNGNITDNSVYEQAKTKIDIDNYIDYIFLHFYADAEDWPNKNGYAAANAASGDGRYRFQVWDQEISLDKFTWNRYGSSGGSMAPFARLKLSEEFRLDFADRVAKHMLNGGALTLANSTGRFQAICDEIDKAIMAESARWGDVQDSVYYATTPGTSTNPFADNYPPTINNPIYFTREQHWLVERDHVIGAHIPIIHDANDSRGIINELRGQNLYPSIDPPVYSQHGGPVPTNFELGMSAGVGNIYYTTDGSDPRLPDGGISTTATMILGGVIEDDFINFEAVGWTYLDTGVAQSNSDVVVGHASYGTGDWKHPNFNDSLWGTGQAMLGYGGITGATINKEIDYGPQTNSKYPTTYFRKEFSVSNAADYTEMLIGVKRDDGAIVYLNGREIARTGMNPGIVYAYADLAAGTAGNADESAVNPFTYSLNAGDLLEGTNVIAVEVHQGTAGSSDLGIDVSISAVKPNGGGASGATLTQTGPVLARALNSGEWSALTEASFIVGTPASSANLVVSEIYYNPPGSLETTEFIELMNSSSTDAIDLTGVTLTGVIYAFPEGFTLAPLERVVIVKDLAGFSAAYNTAGMNIAPGDFGATSLANGGEEIAIIAQDGTTDIQRFEYDDKFPWPESSDGPGFSLVLIAPETTPDHSLPESWRASTASGGSPGASDASTFTGDPEADGDGDSIVAFLEYAIGANDADGGDFLLLPSGTVASHDSGTGVVDEFLTLTFRRNLAADDLIYEVEVGSDLAGWSTSTTFISRVNNGDGTSSEVYRSNTPLSAQIRQFIRLKVSER